MAGLQNVSRDGFAYVFIDPSPQSLKSYLDVGSPLHMELTQVLVWSFDYLLGNNDTKKYKPNWKAVLFYRGVDAGDLRIPYLKEHSSVHAVKADGGELGKPGYELRMPIELAERFIKQSTDEGMTVFDPFARQGTFLLAAKKHSRNAVGYETDESLVEEAVKRGCTRQ